MQSGHPVASSKHAAMFTVARRSTYMYGRSKWSQASGCSGHMTWCSASPFRSCWDTLLPYQRSGLSGRAEIEMSRLVRIWCAGESVDFRSD